MNQRQSAAGTWCPWLTKTRAVEILSGMLLRVTFFPPFLKCEAIWHSFNFLQLDSSIHLASLIKSSLEYLTFIFFLSVVSRKLPLPSPDVIGSLAKGDFLQRAQDQSNILPWKSGAWRRRGVFWCHVQLHRSEAVSQVKMGMNPPSVLRPRSKGSPHTTWEGFNQCLS